MKHLIQRVAPVLALCLAALDWRALDDAVKGDPMSAQSGHDRQGGHP